jgi:hypothetical protein
MDRRYQELAHEGRELLRTTRERLGLTQAELADRLFDLGFRWSQPTVARVLERVTR